MGFCIYRVELGIVEVCFITTIGRMVFFMENCQDLCIYVVHILLVASEWKHSTILIFSNCNYYFFVIYFTEI